MTYHGPSSDEQGRTRIGPKTMADWPEPDLPATDTGINCRKMLLPGPEDITVDYQRGIAFVSSQSRPRGGLGRAVMSVPGAIFGLDIKDSKPEPANLTKDLPEELTPPDGAFHPHGISFWWDQKSGARRLFVINHRKSDPNYVGRERSTVEIFDVLDDRLEHRDTIVDDHSLLSPNDLAATGLNSFYLVNDSGMRAAALKTLEFFLPFGLGKVVYYDDGKFTTITNGVKGGVGIAVDKPCSRLFVSAFSAKRIRVHDIDRETPSLVNRRPSDISLRMGPDNLEWDDQGNLWVAGHPSPLKAVLYMADMKDQAASMVVCIKDGHPVSEPRLVLSDDGTNISASSVAAYDSKRRRLLVGAPFGDHLLMCDIDSTKGAAAAEKSALHTS